MRSTVAPLYQNKISPVEKIGVSGPGASGAVQAFIAKGYSTSDLGAAVDDVIARGRKQGLPFVAIVDSVDTSQAVWDGFYTFSMRVSDTKSGLVVWSNSSTYGRGGILIDAQGTAKDAYHDMVEDFAKRFPPTSSPVASR
jgi:hypothetical protein